MVFSDFLKPGLTRGTNPLGEGERPREPCDFCPSDGVPPPFCSRPSPRGIIAPVLLWRTYPSLLFSAERYF